MRCCVEMTLGKKAWMVFLLAALLRHINGVFSICEFGVSRGNAVYNFSLARAIPNHPHGALSEDGFYKVEANGTLLWFQPCDHMIFNHEPPNCIDCRECGGPLQCGFNCSALLGRQVGGYHVCSTIGRASNMHISLIDDNNPREGVSVKMSAGSLENGCSLTVSVSCDPNGMQGPYFSGLTGTCGYDVMLKHPSGCPNAVSFHGRGWGWFSTFMTTLLCLFGGYMLVGIVYRYFFLGIRGVEVVPNLGFWLAIPRQSQSLIGSLVRRFRRRPQVNRSSYSPVNF